jgi:hypothetical protein
MGSVTSPHASMFGSLTLLKSRKSGLFDINSLPLRTSERVLARQRCQEKQPPIRSKRRTTPSNGHCVSLSFDISSNASLRPAFSGALLGLSG